MIFFLASNWDRIFVTFGYCCFDLYGLSFAIAMEDVNSKVNEINLSRLVYGAYFGSYVADDLICFSFINCNLYFHIYLHFYEMVLFLR